MATKKNPRNTKPVTEAVEAAPKTPPPGKCVVCGAEVAPFSSEELCWVCRRLKISAWRESADNQAAMQE
jgi:hypothetical protein